MGNVYLRKRGQKSYDIVPLRMAGGFGWHFRISTNKGPNVFCRKGNETADETNAFYSLKGVTRYFSLHFFIPFIVAALSALQLLFLLQTTR